MLLRKEKFTCFLVVELLTLTGKKLQRVKALTLYILAFFPDYINNISLLKKFKRAQKCVAQKLIASYNLSSAYSPLFHDNLYSSEFCHICCNSYNYYWCILIYRKYILALTFLLTVFWTFFWLVYIDYMFIKKSTAYYLIAYILP